jgi:hypothetical protein
VEAALAQHRQQVHTHQQLTLQPGEEAPPPPEPSSWLPTLRHLVAAGVPCLFTSYSAKEAEEDAQVGHLGLPGGTGQGRLRPRGTRTGKGLVALSRLPWLAVAGHRPSGF